MQIHLNCNKPHVSNGENIWCWNDGPLMTLHPDTNDWVILLSRDYKRYHHHLISILSKPTCSVIISSMADSHTQYIFTTPSHTKMGGGVDTQRLLVCSYVVFSCSEVFSSLLVWAQPLLDKRPTGASHHLTVTLLSLIQTSIGEISFKTQYSLEISLLLCLLFFYENFFCTEAFALICHATFCHTCQDPYVCVFVCGWWIQDSFNQKLLKLKF